ncbi:hypothetical protein J6G99_06350 [bacterium]|nr:hypothetical protein [bacterium]
MSTKLTGGAIVRCDELGGTLPSSSQLQTIAKKLIVNNTYQGALGEELGLPSLTEFHAKKGTPFGLYANYHVSSHSYGAGAMNFIRDFSWIGDRYNMSGIDEYTNKAYSDTNAGPGYAICIKK